ncbi:hypothetical protein XELAEV_18012268mg [Xenopus laevis]|uniref:Uncharacterized protein n=1 Tax=Xenopus laevis TaxID=8355 RepID=A0A974DQ24_XENLA|nr:hypothetical protein XELAEV_18012268mg [Xenopus laevis]
MLNRAPKLVVGKLEGVLEWLVNQQMNYGTVLLRMGFFVWCSIPWHHKFSQNQLVVRRSRSVKCCQCEAEVHAYMLQTRQAIK